MNIFEPSLGMVAVNGFRLEALPGLDGGCHAYTSNTPSHHIRRLNSTLGVRNARQGLTSKA